jgi:hypothetical protein
MGGMDEMGEFYDDCLGALYPPGICGTFCNGKRHDSCRDNPVADSLASHVQSTPMSAFSPRSRRHAATREV